MVTMSELQALVAARYARLDLPTWPDPHPNGTSPRDEEYSRVTDPERYRLVHARAGVWTAVLEEELGAVAEPLAPTSIVAGGHPRSFDRGVRLTRPLPGALPLVLLERDVEMPSGDATLAVLEIAVARPDVVVQRQPDCGCDACDSGSDRLLEAIDSAIGRVIGGPFVALRSATWSAQWHPQGGGAGGEGRGPDFPAVMDLCRRLGEGQAVRLPKRTEAFVGGTWLT